MWILEKMDMEIFDFLKGIKLTPNVHLRSQQIYPGWGGPKEPHYFWGTIAYVFKWKRCHETQGSKTLGSKDLGS